MDVVLCHSLLELLSQKSSTQKEQRQTQQRHRTMIQMAPTTCNGAICFFCLSVRAASVDYLTVVGGEKGDRPAPNNNNTSASVFGSSQSADDHKSAFGCCSKTSGRCGQPLGVRAACCLAARVAPLVRFQINGAPSLWRSNQTPEGQLNVFLFSFDLIWRQLFLVSIH